MNMKYDPNHTFVTSDHHFRDWAHLGGVLAESTQEVEPPPTTCDSICVCAKWHGWKPITLADAIRRMLDEAQACQSRFGRGS